MHQIFVIYNKKDKKNRHQIFDLRTQERFLKKFLRLDKTNQLRFNEIIETRFNSRFNGFNKCFKRWP